MSPTTWRGTDDVSGFVLGRLGHLDWLVGGGFDGHNRAPAGVKPDLFGGGARQVDHGPSAHPVIDQHNHRVAAILHRDPHLGAQRHAAAGSGHRVLIENRPAAGAIAVMGAPIPGRHTDIARPGLGSHREEKRDCGDDHPGQATLDRHLSDELPLRPPIPEIQDRAATRTVSVVGSKSKWKGLCEPADKLGLGVKIVVLRTHRVVGTSGARFLYVPFITVLSCW
jgi:hypothetical protein